jgi:CBS domain-containing protein
MRKLGEMHVDELMTSDVITVASSERLSQAIRTMDNFRLSVVPALDDLGRVNGLLSATDLVELFHEVQSDLGALSIVKPATQEVLLQLLIRQGDTTTVDEVMTSPVETVSSGTNIIVAARKMSELGYHHLPVVNDEGCPVGILSSMDIVRAVAQCGPTLAG